MANANAKIYVAEAAEGLVHKERTDTVVNVNGVKMKRVTRYAVSAEEAQKEEGRKAAPKGKAKQEAVE